MKNQLTAFIFVIALAGVSLAQAPSKASSGRSGKPRIAVVEFNDASGVMTFEAKRHFQASLAFELVKKRDFEVPDVRNTRAATPAGQLSASSAVKIGKQLNVDYVLFGTVTEYSTTRGQITVRTQLVDVTTGKVKLSDETTAQSASAMTAKAGEAEMSAKVVKPLVQKLFATLIAANL